MAEAMNPLLAVAAVRVAVVVLNWNGKNDTIECLRSLSKVKHPSFCVVVADNGSSDGSEKAIRQEFPRLRLIQNGANLGFAEGNNRAIEQALRLSWVRFTA